MKPEYHYVEIIKYETREVVKRIDVTGMSERQIDRIEYGATINLNHNDYYIEVNAYDSIKEKI